MTEPFLKPDAVSGKKGQEEFDCGHTVPLFTLGQAAAVKLTAREERDVTFRLLEPLVS